MEELSIEKLAATQQFDDTPFLGPDRQIDARMVFTHTLFFTDGATQGGQKRAVETLGLLARNVEDHIAVMALNDGGLQPWDAGQFRDGAFETIDRAFAQHSDQRDLDLAFHGETAGQVSAFGGSLAIVPPLVEEDADLNYLEASTTLVWDAESAFRLQIDRMIAAASLLKPVHGLGGFGLLFGRAGASTSSKARLVPVMHRFAGLHCGLNTAFVVEAAMRRPTPDRYFTVNWLTAIGDAMLAQLPAGALATLPASCPVHNYEGGVIIQAGPHPQIGDTNRGFVPEDYRAVEAVLAPLRFEEYGVGILSVPSPRDSLSETLRWVRRFD